jgi:hypothetical protein
MKKNTLTLLQTILSLNGFVIDKATDKEAIETLIKKLKPYCTDKALIRLGASGDGGYLVPDDLAGISTCFSPGVGAFSTFEEACVEHGMQVYLADNSVDEPVIKNDNFHFIKRYIGPITDGNFISIRDWVNSNLDNNDSDLLLQMDIEGHEYLTITSMTDDLLNRFRILVVEFHYLGKLWNKEFFKMASTAFHKILQNHTCVHIHPNNYCGIERIRGIEIPRTAEFTFLRNDRIQNKHPQTNFPHPLDFDNIHSNAIVLPQNWYSRH